MQDLFHGPTQSFQTKGRLCIPDMPALRQAVNSQFQGRCNAMDLKKWEKARVRIYLKVEVERVVQDGPGAMPSTPTTPAT